LYRSKDMKVYLEGIYEVTKNESNPSTKGEMSSYFGAMRLELDDDIHPAKLDGRYWSNKFTRGLIKLVRKA
ncbi:MAG: hypothetical protein JWO94_3479, partial [Verrucomicrobiaceae bacterium]|nr:hypothetical protein [Verrucomicrobiaceae bacterium]